LICKIDDIVNGKKTCLSLLLVVVLVLLSLLLLLEKNCD